MNTDVERIVESKERERRRLAALPFAEKLTLMEQLRDRQVTIMAGRNPSPDTILSDRVLLLREQQAPYDREAARLTKTAKAGGES